MDNFLTTEKTGHVLRVTLNRPERRNALSTPICEGLLALPGRVEADLDIRCVVITGAGEGFCSGADLKERREL
jgi:enoyl-CoA hydratase